MSEIYHTQNKLRIQATLGVNITGALELQIRYRNPKGNTGTFTATSLDDENGIIYYDLITPLEYVGYWLFWGYVKFNDGRVAPGDVVKIKVKMEGT